MFYYFSIGLGKIRFQTVKDYWLRATPLGPRVWPGSCSLSWRVYTHISSLSFVDVFLSRSKTVRISLTSSNHIFFIHFEIDIGLILIRLNGQSAIQLRETWTEILAFFMFSSRYNGNEFHENKKDFKDIPSLKIIKVITLMISIVTIHDPWTFTVIDCLG